MPEFAAATLPWTDRPGFHRELSRRLASGGIGAGRAAALRAWREDGYLVLRGAVPDGLIAAMWEHHERAWRDRPLCTVESWDRREAILPGASAAEGRRAHAYLVAFHNLSEAAGRIVLGRALLSWCRLILGEVPVAVQTNLFEYPSEFPLHQDFAYLPVRIPSHNVNAWVACERVGEPNGPVLLYPGSHRRVPKYDFGGGRLMWGRTGTLASYQAYLGKACRRLGLAPVPFLAERGDVLLFHAAMVHGGAPAARPRETRRGLAIHYSSLRAHPRSAQGVTRAVRGNGGLYYVLEAPGHVEGRYRLGGRAGRGARRSRELARAAAAYALSAGG